jgi:hypothetical protein
MASAAERFSDGASEEKKIGNELGHDHIEDPRHTIENLPDPDAGLSNEERAAHVSEHFLTCFSYNCRLAHTTESIRE